MKAIEQYVNVVLFIMLYKVVLTFKSMDETLVCDYSNEGILSCGIVCLQLFSIQERRQFKAKGLLTSSEVKDFKCSNTASISVETILLISPRNFLSQPYSLSFESTAK